MRPGRRRAAGAAGGRAGVAVGGRKERDGVVDTGVPPLLEVVEAVGEERDAICEEGGTGGQRRVSKRFRDAEVERRWKKQ